MNEMAELFYSIGEPFAAGLFEEPQKGYFYRYACAYARYFENLRPAEYIKGDLLYPRRTGFFDTSIAMRPQFARTYQVNWELLESKSAEAAGKLRNFTEISNDFANWDIMKQMHPEVKDALREHPDIPEYFDAYTHAAPNYKRILAEGLDSYRLRAAAAEDAEFREGLLLLLDALKQYIDRSVEYLKHADAPEELISAMKQVPFAPAQTYYEGLVAWNLIFYFDGGDNLGYLDNGLAHLYAGEDLTEVIRQMFENIDALDGWSCTIGPDYNEITYQALKAIKNRRRPLLELRTVPGMPEKYWQVAAEMIRDGSSNPAFYNDQGIHDLLKERYPQTTEEELAMFVGCGCTETNFQGMTRVGGVDDSVPLLKIFEQVLHGELKNSGTFEVFYEKVCEAIKDRIFAQLDVLAAYYDYKAAYQPNPMRTLFTDDCIEKEKDFNAGGARYTWTLTSISSLVNTIDSLLAVRDLVYERKLFAPEAFLEKLTAEDPVFYQILQTCPCFGTNQERADQLAAEFAERVYRVFREKPLKSFIDGYMLSEHQFLRYTYHGEKVGPTPDGRKGGMPTSDSIAAVRGKATDGPTAMLSSSAKLPQHLVDGISVLNLTLTKNSVETALKPLGESYFAMGGIQVQVTATSAEELKDAYEHPEKHRDLIVRVGGYSEYFVRLTPEMRKTVLDRNLHEL